MYPLLSIIIPTYNSFHLMSRCLNSLEKLNLNDVEVVIIDDCSTDNTYEKLQEYKSRSTLKMLIEQNETNSGPGVSRNNGLKLASGKYITFLDSDDYFSEEFSPVIYPLLLENYDCIIFDVFMKYNDGKELKWPMFFRPQPKGLIEPRTAFVFVKGATVGKIYLRTIIADNDISFLSQKRYEDIPFTICTIACCKEIYYVKKPLYAYVQHSASLIHNYDLTNPKNAENAFAYIYNKLYDRFPVEVEALFIRERLYSQMRQEMQIVSKAEMSKLIDDMVKQFPNYLKNPYFLKERFRVRFSVYCMHKKWFFMLKIIDRINNLRNKFIYRT